MSNKAVVDDIKGRIDLREVIPELVRKGARFFRKCPFHGGGNERTPSMMVDTDHYYCYACQSFGDVFDWLKQDKDMDFKEALVFLASELGIALDANDVRGMQRRAKQRQEMAEEMESFQTDADPARAYLSARGLSDATMDLAHIGYEERADAAVLPFCDAGGRPIGITKRYMSENADPRYRTFNNDNFKLRDNVWGLHVAARAPGERLYLVEGQIDCMSLWEQGIQRAVAYVMGAPTAGQVRQLERYFPEEEWVLVPDNKSANDWEIFERAYGRIMETDSKRLCRVVIPPLGLDVNAALQEDNMGWLNDLKPVPIVRAEHIATNGMARDAQYAAGRVVYYETPDDLVRSDLVAYFATQWGKEASTIRDYFQADENEAPVAQVRTVTGALDIAEEQIDAMIEKKWHMGFTPLRGLIPYPMPGKLMGMVAEPTVGKTTYAINWIRKMRELQLPTLVVSYEQPAFELAIKLALCTSYEMNRPVSYQDIYSTVYGRADNETWGWMRRIMTQLYPHVVFCEDNPTADDLPGLVTQYGMQIGEPIKIVIIDYLGLLPPPAGLRSSSVYDVTTARMEALKSASKGSEALWFFLHHPGRSKESQSDRLGIHAGKGSSAVEDMTDYLMTMWGGERESGARQTHVDLVKNKGGRSGEFTLYHGEEFAIMESTMHGVAKQTPDRSVSTRENESAGAWAADEGDPFEQEGDVVEMFVERT